MNKNSLIKRLKENDPLVKFVPFGFSIGKRNLFEFLKNRYIQERYGEEGADKITEFASFHPDRPDIRIYNSVDEEKTEISVLSNYWNYNGIDYLHGAIVSSGIDYLRRAIVDSNYRPVQDGYSFGICFQNK